MPAIAGFTLTPDRFWAPTTKLVNVAALFTVTDASGAASCSLTAVEPGDDRGDGHTGVDVIVQDVHNLQLRAERAGNGGGRTYTARLTCSDPSGNVATATAVARVVNE